MATIQYVENKNEFEEILQSNERVIVNFTANWCGPCASIAPVLEELALDNQSIRFIKVDVDQNEEVTAEQGIRAMPTFKCYLKGERYNELIGANSTKLRDMVRAFSNVE